MLRFLLCLVLAVGLSAANRDPLASVNPLIGTQKSRIGYGGTMPFVSPPFAMTNWTPQTRQNKISITSYEYDDAAITGFIGTHQPAIWMGDYG
jgi:putative alpha-1,2-mannosidase